MKKLSVEQHQMLEDLTGLQHTKNGTVRNKQNRTRNETIRLGLRDPELEMIIWTRNFLKNPKRFSAPKPSMPAGPGMLEKLLGKKSEQTTR